MSPKDFFVEQFEEIEGWKVSKCSGTRGGSITVTEEGNEKNLLSDETEIKNEMNVYDVLLVRNITNDHFSSQLVQNAKK